MNQESPAFRHGELSIYLLGIFDEDKLEKFNEPDISTWEYLRIIILTIISCLAVFAVAWFLISGRIGLGPYLTF